ncbi:GATOR complex protein DEPDC5-like [Schistocerca gregaria]|uniref:GATOR complex protein DEPDC5-like n=1 Tax=Schistocerca gregaria TaxID=7010 RepID=UPI00211E4FDA|nr:GATOR complex protein DEPDC5-like [Schistocerca gregaria]
MSTGRGCVCTLWVHDQRFSHESLTVNPDLFPLQVKVGDVIELARPAGSPRRLYLPVGAAVSKANLQLSIKDAIAKSCGLSHRDEVEVRRVEREEAAVDAVKLTFSGQFVSRGDMWRLWSHLVGTCVYSGKIVWYRCIRAKIRELSIADEVVYSGSITERTKFAFSSRSASVILLVQMSREMWEYAPDGDLYFEKLADRFLPLLFARWRACSASHSVTLVLFSRTYYAARGAEGAEDEPDARDYEDFYTVLCTGKNSGWEELVLSAKRNFAKYPAMVNWSVDGNAENGGPVGENSTAELGGILEAIYLGQNTMALRQYKDIDLTTTAQHIMVITPKTSVFSVDGKLEKWMKQKMSFSEVRCHLICLGEPPLHAAPLFIVPLADSSSDRPAKFKVPYWICLSYFKNRSPFEHRPLDRCTPRQLLPNPNPRAAPDQTLCTQLVALNLENEVHRSLNSAVKPRADPARDYDARVFQCAPSTAAEGPKSHFPRNSRIAPRRFAKKSGVGSSSGRSAPPAVTGPSHASPPADSSEDSSTEGRAAHVLAEKKPPVQNKKISFARSVTARGSQQRASAWGDDASSYHFLDANNTSTTSWKQITQFTVMPLHTRYFPSDSELKFHCQEYTHGLIPNDDPPRSRELYLLHFTSQRLSRGYQLVEKANTKKVSGGKKEDLVVREYFLSSMFSFHHLMHVPPYINVKCYVSNNGSKTANGGSKTSAYHYRLNVDGEQSLRLAKLQPPPAPYYPWNSVDRILSGLEFAFTPSMNYWCNRFVLVAKDKRTTPDTANAGFSKFKDFLSQRILKSGDDAWNEIRVCLHSAEKTSHCLTANQGTKIKANDTCAILNELKSSGLLQSEPPDPGKWRPGLPAPKAIDWVLNHVRVRSRAQATSLCTSLLAPELPLSPRPPKLQQLRGEHLRHRPALARAEEEPPRRTATDSKSIPPEPDLPRAIPPHPETPHSPVQTSTKPDPLGLPNRHPCCVGCCKTGTVRLLMDQTSARDEPPH